MPRLVGVNHVVLEVADIEQALEFYSRLFEFRLRGRLPRMAFIDMGDQFLVLAEVAEPDGPDDERHFGLVVDDREELRRRLVEAGAEILPSRGLDFRDPWGNRVQVVQYSDIQFSKAPPVLHGMGMDHLEKSRKAQKELKDKGLLD
jgi:lactoylglutathione lyase